MKTVLKRKSGFTLIELMIVEVHRAVPALLALLAERGAEVSDLAPHHASLEDVFVALTGRHLRDA